MTNPSSTQDLKLNIAELKRLWFVEDAQKHIAKSVEIQMRLGDVYSDLAQIDSPKINLTYAIEAYSKALSYGYWQETDATYALIQVRLGIDYYELASHENGTANLYHAIEAYKKTLSFWTKDNALAYGMVQTNLGAAYNKMALIEDQKNNLQIAANYYTEALLHRTPQNDVLGFAELHANLGIIYQAQGKISEAVRCWKIGEAYFRQHNRLKDASRLSEWILNQKD